MSNRVDIDYLKITIRPCHSVNKIIPLRNLSHRVLFFVRNSSRSPRHYRFQSQSKKKNVAKIYFTPIPHLVPTNKTWNPLPIQLLNYPTRHVSEELSIKSDKKQASFAKSIRSLRSISPLHASTPAVGYRWRFLY